MNGEDHFLVRRLRDDSFFQTSDQFALEAFIDETLGYSMPLWAPSTECSVVPG